MKKINLRGISEILSEKELKNVMGGSGAKCDSSDGICSGNCSYQDTSGKLKNGTCKWNLVVGCRCE